MAVFLIKALLGSDFVPPPATGLFSDVPVGSIFAPWIERLFIQKITGGCGGGTYCPGSPNTRGQMAVFLTKTFLGSPVVTVHEPAFIAGDYPAAGADFGPRLTLLGVTAGTVLADDAAGGVSNDACQPLTPENAAAAAGKILLALRGNCTFVTKVKHAQDAGAVGVIVYDDLPGRIPAWMPGSDPSITIPSVLVSEATANVLVPYYQFLNVTIGAKLSGRAAARAAQGFSLPEGIPRKGPVALPPLRESTGSPGPRPPGQ
jgi:hypothetical protein